MKNKYKLSDFKINDQAGMFWIRLKECRETFLSKQLRIEKWNHFKSRQIDFTFNSKENCCSMSLV